MLVVIGRMQKVIGRMHIPVIQAGYEASDWRGLREGYQSYARGLSAICNVKNILLSA